MSNTKNKSVNTSSTKTQNEIKMNDLLEEMEDMEEIEESRFNSRNQKKIKTKILPEMEKLLHDGYKVDNNFFIRFI